METMKALIDRLEKLSDEANVNAVFGKPETVEGRVLIPVAEVMYGFGMGAGGAQPHECTCGCEVQDEGEACCQEEPCCEEDTCECDTEEAATGAGGGAGAHVRPIAYIEVGPDGTQVKSIVDEQKVALAGIMLGFWAIGWVGLVLKTLFTRGSRAARA
ncbi:MAG: hypothetical protein JXC32_13620 [Anaerolineae bacterium]|nr:hypothetical protein [Anaerolineae bacterium]